MRSLCRILVVFAIVWFFSTAPLLHASEPLPADGAHATAEAHGDDHGDGHGITHQMKEMGLFGILTPEEYGGMGMSIVCSCIIQEELSRANLCYPMYISGNIGIGTMGALIMAGILGDFVGPRSIFAVTGIVVLTAGVASVFTLRSVEEQLVLNGMGDQPSPPLE
mgnify:CR=1 FL=1